jgi:hypothetical protein
VEKRVAELKRWQWVILWLIALLVRLGAAFALPNAELDGYSYAETIALYSERLAAGQFHLADLYGFWLPLFQLTAAILNLAIRDSLLAGQILSALCGAATCVLVFAVAKKLTESIGLALLAFGLLLVDPLHILYSAAAMTDVPFGCLILASLWFALNDRWVSAAIFAALAGGVRIEAWALIPLLPIAQFCREKRVSLLACVLLLVSPIVWFLICYAATGDFFAYFARRAAYQTDYLAFHPTRAGFVRDDVWRDVNYFLLGANPLVGVAVVVTLGVLVGQAIRGRRVGLWPPVLTSFYILSILMTLVIAYVTKQQPVILPRYGFFLLVLGLPLFAWLLHLFRLSFRAPWFVTLVTVLMLVAVVELSVWQLPVVGKVCDDFRAQKRVAGALVSELKQMKDPMARCFTDDPAVRVLSRLPRERFLRSETTPLAVAQDGRVFLFYLRIQNVTHLVFLNTEVSLPVELLPELGETVGQSTDNFQFVAMQPSDFGPSIWLYRLKGGD